jgi:hypothetical protein
MESTQDSCGTGLWQAPSVPKEGGRRTPTSIGLPPSRGPSVLSEHHGKGGPPGVREVEPFRQMGRFNAAIRGPPFCPPARFLLRHPASRSNLGKEFR